MRQSGCLHFLLLLVLCCVTSILAAQETALKDGWEREVEIPELKRPDGETYLRPAKVRLWVEQGWLCARRTDAEGAVEWQIALAQLEPGAAPTIEADQLGGLDIAYGRYFIRENFGRLRVLRERKDALSAAWPTLLMSSPVDRPLGNGSMPARQVVIKAFVSGGWCWVVSGLANDRPDIWLRLERHELWKPGHGFESGPKPARMFFGGHHAIDEGDLFIATRSSVEVSERALAALKIRETLGTKPAPAIVASKWFNSPEALSLENLRDKVVLLDFWGTWCGPCVEKLPAVEALHKKFADRGLVVIGVHSAQAGESVEGFLEKRPLAFPIALDTGETAKSYAINSWPTYFLIDKSGQAQWGYFHTPPSESQIEELLK